MICSHADSCRCMECLLFTAAGMFAESSKEEIEPSWHDHRLKVMIMPLFNLWAYPEEDGGTWRFKFGSVSCSHWPTHQGSPIAGQSHPQEYLQEV